MRILHCCLANFYIDNFGYQENVLPRTHKKLGYEVMILASTENNHPGEGYVFESPSDYINEDGILVRRVPYWGLFPPPPKVASKIRIYQGVFETVSSFKPDVIFMHDAQTAAVFSIIKYLKKHLNCRLYVDSHTDYVNSARTWGSKYILHGMLYRWYVRKTIPYAIKYYGTLPARVSFYRDFYGTPADKTEYLPFGVDDLSIPMNRRDEIRRQVRLKHEIADDEFVVITGGKLTAAKNSILLMKAFAMLCKQIEGIRLLIFGTVSAEIKEQFDNLLRDNNKIIYVGWVPSKETYNYFFASDLACFPGTHSTLWEESVGYGLPAIFKHWDGITQIDLNGNCELLEEPISPLSIATIIKDIYTNKKKYELMKSLAETKGMRTFSYSRIAKYCIGEAISENLDFEHPGEPVRKVTD